MLAFIDEDKPMIERIYIKMAPTLRKYAYNKLHDAQLAADTVQQSVLDFMEHFHKITFISESKLCGYIYTITANNVMDVLRKQRKQIPSADIDICSENINTEEVVLGLFSADEIRHCISRLSPNYALYLQMKYLDSFDAEFIAKVLKVKPASLRMIEHRAKLQLKQLLEEAEVKNS